MILSKKQILCNKIKSEVRRRNLNRNEFADLMNVQPCIITRWFKKEGHNFTVDTLVMIEEKLNIKLICLDLENKSDSEAKSEAIMSVSQSIKDHYIFSRMERVWDMAIEHQMKKSGLL